MGSTGTIGYGIVDIPAHMAVCAVALLALSAISRSRLTTRFVVAALVASAAIDLDHLPGYLGDHLITGSLPRPYTHSAFLVAGLVAIGLALRRRDLRLVSLGIAFGVATHLFRDLATGPGVPLFWPLSSDVVAVPYVFFALTLALAAAAVAAPRRIPLAARLGLPVALAMLAAGTSGAIPARAAPSRDAIGVYIPGSEWNPALLDSYASAVGRQPATVSIYGDWSSQPFEPTVLDSIAARGAMPMVTWEPWRNWSEAVPLHAIADGSEDAYIAESARAAAAWGAPLFLRFAQEMNGSWYPWGRVPGNTPAAYRAAWRHLVEVFRQQGARNVRWVWTPYVEGDGQRPFRRYYPGGKWVDWAGMDGFNWGSKFVSFAKLFQRSYMTMVRMTKKPLIIAETGSVEYGGSKPEWIRRALGRALPRYRHIRALVWWDGVHPTKGTDVRLDTSPESFAAWSQALQAPRLDEGREFLLARPAWLRKR